MSIFERYATRYEESREEVLSLQEYLELCRSDPRPTPPLPNAC